MQNKTCILDEPPSQGMTVVTKKLGIAVNDLISLGVEFQGLLGRKSMVWTTEPKSGLTDAVVLYTQMHSLLMQIFECRSVCM